MTYEDRILLREAVSRIQAEKERKARRLVTVTVYGEKISMGGGARAYAEQNRAGYTASDGHLLPSSR